MVLGITVVIGSGDLIGSGVVIAAGHSSGTGFLEYIDARGEPVRVGVRVGVGWR